MTRDPIVEEVHRIRRELLGECGGDLRRLCERLKAAEAAHPERLASPRRRRRQTVAEQKRSPED